MNRVFLAGGHSDQRSALQLLLEELGMQVAGESTRWSSVLNLGPTTHPDVVAVDWGLISSRTVSGLRELRSAYPNAILIVFPGHLDAIQISKLIAETSDFTYKRPFPARSSSGVAISRTSPKTTRKKRLAHSLPTSTPHS